jgi:hypothetical protein
MLLLIGHLLAGPLGSVAYIIARAMPKCAIAIEIAHLNAQYGLKSCM